jgi:hypothetical protein
VLCCAGGGKVLRYTPDSRPPWLPQDVPWEAALFAKAQQQQLALLYTHSSKALRELLLQDIRSREVLQ